MNDAADVLGVSNLESTGLAGCDRTEWIQCVADRRRQLRFIIDINACGESNVVTPETLVLQMLLRTVAGEFQNLTKPNKNIVAVHSERVAAHQ